MPDHLDFDDARRALREVPVTDTWSDAMDRAATGIAVQVGPDDPTDPASPRWRRHGSSSSFWPVALAACVVAAIAVAAIALPDPETVRTADLGRSPATTPECPDSAIGQDSSGGAMNHRSAAQVAAGATAMLLIGACSDGPRTLARGEDVELVGDDDLAGQTLDISVEEDDGTVTGAIRFTDPGGQVVVTVECADTETDGVVILGGTITESTDDEMSGLSALFIKEGDPDRVAVWLDEGDNESCRDLLENRRDVIDDETLFVDVEAGSDIETG